MGSGVEEAFRQAGGEAGVFEADGFQVLSFELAVLETGHEWVGFFK